MTGPKGKAASSYEEDLKLTLQLIMDHDKRSTTVSKDQFVQQMQQSAAVDNAPEKVEAIDVSIPYDAAAKLAYDKAGGNGDFAKFKAQYEADAVAEVKAKRGSGVKDALKAPVDAKAAKANAQSVKKKSAPAASDVSIPYDAAAKLAYDKAGGKGDYAAFKEKYEADAVADVKAKNGKSDGGDAAAPGEDVSIPYDAAAKLAYDKAGGKGDYAAFKEKYEADAVADVKAKNGRSDDGGDDAAAPGDDVSIPYDAAAKLAYQAAGGKGDYAAFRQKYEAEAVELVKSKRQ